ncbi:MAG TPA: potassium-transporting ATPase subunit KdpB, partial [Roseiarcus sp.]|nr:potassium-transporting ATPase subunit KdpB [Roseiarcus sp.]
MNTAVHRAPAPVQAIKLVRRRDLFSSDIVATALKQSFFMLRPDIQWKNPVMFVVEVGAVLTLLYIIQAALGFSSSSVSLTYFIALDVWLFLTVLFANFATAIAEERGRAQAETLRKTRVATPAFRLRADGTTENVSSIALKPGDLVVVQASQIIPGDGDVIEGGAVVNEAAITGESAPVIREAGGDRSGVTGGTTVLSDRIVVRISAGVGESFLDKMIALVEGARRQRTPNEIALTLVLTAFTLIFMIVVVPLWPMALNAETYMTSYLGLSDPLKSLGTDVPTLIALIVCLIPTTIGALLAAIGIAGMDRALRANIIAKSGKAVEVAGDIDTVLLDKTGTITIGDRQAREFIPLDVPSEGELMRIAALASVSDQTPEGKSIVAAYTHIAGAGVPVEAPAGAGFVPFTAQSRMSGVNLPGGVEIRKGAPDAIARHVASKGGALPSQFDGIVARIGARGATPLAVSQNGSVVGLIAHEDILKPGIRERMAQLRLMGLRTVMITGDNPLTAHAIAKQAGVDDFIAEATPEKKLVYLRDEQAQGKLVAMMGDGTNDAPSLAQADVGLAMNSGTQAAKEAGNMVDLDSDPTKLIEVVA